MVNSSDINKYPFRVGDTLEIFSKYNLLDTKMIKQISTYSDTLTESVKLIFYNSISNTDHAFTNGSTHSNDSSITDISVRLKSTQFYIYNKTDLSINTTTNEFIIKPDWKLNWNFTNTVDNAKLQKFENTLMTQTEINKLNGLGDYISYYDKNKESKLIYITNNEGYINPDDFSNNYLNINRNELFLKVNNYLLEFPEDYNILTDDSIILI